MLNLLLLMTPLSPLITWLIILPHIYFEILFFCFYIIMCWIFYHDAPWDHVIRIPKLLSDF